jgi:serine/threonine protein kinase
MGLLGSFKTLFGSTAKVSISSRFELLREAISGTMSAFYMARDRTTDQIVGLKILDPEKTAALEARFVGIEKPKEGEIAVTLVHPNIVKTFEHGVTTGGEQYLVMEYLEGAGMNSLIVGRSPQLEGRRMNLMRQMAQALDAVHKAGYIHRDVCPRNFVVDKSGESVTLIDFGLSVPATPQFMQPGNRTGTANYMAPEVVRRRRTSQKLDIFSFGVTIYELCAFELPWPRGAGKEAMTHGSQEPSEIRKFCPMIDMRLEQAISACIEPVPENRPASMEEFLKLIKDVERENVA